jgi:hypothetical protein
VGQGKGGERHPLHMMVRRQWWWVVGRGRDEGRDGDKGWGNVQGGDTHTCLVCDGLRCQDW